MRATDASTGVAGSGRGALRIGGASILAANRCRQPAGEEGVTWRGRGRAHGGRAYDGRAYDGRAHDGRAHDGRAHGGRAHDGRAHRGGSLRGNARLRRCRKPVPGGGQFAFVELTSLGARGVEQRA